MKTTDVFDSYWRFAAERHAMYLRRLTGQPGPWSDDPILNSYRFTNTYRAADRVSQFLISEVQYGAHRSQAPAEVFFRTILFKIFNKIEVWQLLERELGSISWQATPLGDIKRILDDAHARGRRLYSAAYIMPSPDFGADRKHHNHLMLLEKMMRDGLPGKIASAPSLEEVFYLLVQYRGIGGFLAFQFAIDLNYSSILHFSEEDFVVAGPGALDGIAKCFPDTGGRSAEEVIYWIADNQDREFTARGIEFPGLFGRRLMPIDCQNLFCEISKYARAAHPDITGPAKRTKIKQRYTPLSLPVPQPFFPPKWGLTVPKELCSPPDLLGLA